LLIEDNPADARWIQEMLAGGRPGGALFAAFELAHVERLSQALAALAEGTFEAILLDLSLPDSDGLETLHRTLDAAPGVPVVALTGLDNEAMALQAVREGAQDYLVKGQVNEHWLARAISYAIERKRLLETSALLGLAIEQAAESIMITALDGTIQYVNSAFERITGYGWEEALGQNPRILKSGQHDAEFYQAMWATLTRGEVWVGHFINKRKDGTLYEEEAVISPVCDTTGRIVNYVAIKRDMTYERQLEVQLRQAQKMEAIGRLAGGVAHDFNNLLTVIMGNADFLLGETAPDHPGYRKLQIINDAAERAAQLTRQLLAFSRRQVLRPQVLNLNTIVADMEKMLRRLIGEDIDLVTVLKPDLGQMEADPGQIEQVILNLAVNARDAMPQGGKLTLETDNIDLDEIYASQHAGVTPGRYVMLAVSDTGHGMDQATRQQIFEPFFTTKEMGKGTGLGLATVYGIVKQSQGHIWVYSEPGKGTTFKIYLPRADRDTGPVMEPVAPVKAHQGTETILLVEDDTGVRSLAREVLARSGYTVLEALHGEEALVIVQQHPGSIDLLVTDVVMPRMSGRELARRLVSLHPEIRVLYISGYTDNAIMHQGVLETSVAFLQKPIRPEALVRKVQEVLDASDIVF